jgi:hypothetical protein
VIRRAILALITFGAEAAYAGARRRARSKSSFPTCPPWYRLSSPPTIRTECAGNADPIVSGVPNFVFRATANSRITYKQQIGRFCFIMETPTPFSPISMSVAINLGYRKRL